MRALTIHQPWASLIAAGLKTIETRAWATKHRGQIVIHAGQQAAQGRLPVQRGGGRCVRS